MPRGKERSRQKIIKWSRYDSEDEGGPEERGGEQEEEGAKDVFFPLRVSLSKHSLTHSKFRRENVNGRLLD